MDNTRLTYTSLPDAAPRDELDALAAVYRFVLECQENKKAADATGDRDEVKEVRNIDPGQSLP